MITRLNSLIAQFIRKLGYDIVKFNKDPRLRYLDIKDQDFWQIHDRVKNYTMTSIENQYMLYNSVRYIIKNNIQGSFVECGVWRGGSALLIALTLENLNIFDRKIYLFDTFEGMSEPTDNDLDLQGTKAESHLKENVKDNENHYWCYATIDDVKETMSKSKISKDNFIYIKGKVEETIPTKFSMEEIALLRLDTDWYESTKHEMIHLYPKLEKNGILIIDDYGHWEGSRKAVDEYINDNKLKLNLFRIDYTVRVAINNI
jgi:O-methyltransferase